MTIEGDYFYGEQLRWNLLWASPNHAGAFLAALIPLLWLLGAFWGRSRSTMFAGLGFVLLAEGSLMFLLCKTFSRGGFVALGAAWLAYAIFQAALARDLVSRELWRVLLPHAGRAVVMLALLVTTGAAGRVSGEYMANDASVGNRVELWAGGVKMIAAALWRGVGVGQSGGVYMQWFQPLEHTEGYRTLVNGYLTFAAERGLPLAVLALSGLVLPLVLLIGRAGTWRGQSKQLDLPRQTAIAAACSLVAWLCVNVFSTFLEVISLLALGAFAWFLAIAAFTLVDHQLLRKRLPGGAAISILVALLLSGGVVILGNQLGRKTSPTVGLLERCVILNPNGAISAAIVPDESVLGRDYGKELRRLALATPKYRWTVVPPGDLAARKALSKQQLIVLTGRGADLVGELKGKSTRVIIVHPAVGPNEGLAYDNFLVLLPGFDQLGLGATWAEKVPGMIYTALSGQDLRAHWPEALVDHLPAEE